MKIFFLLGVFVLHVFGFNSSKVLAQNSSTKRISSKLERWQDSLQNLGHIMYQDLEEQNRLDANFKFIRTLVTALKEPHSIDFSFDSLKMISVLTSPDQKLRIYSWNVPLHDGSYLYYGTVQMRTANGDLKLIPLLDKTFEIEKPELTLLQSNNWYGAQYYEIIPYQNYYLLLGWKGHTPAYSQRVIEVLHIQDGVAVLGAKIFDHPDFEQHQRIIFSYAKQASMFLTFQKEEGRIVFDHLAPIEPKYVGNYQFYGPDFTFDAWELRTPKMKFFKNVSYKNP